MSFVSMIIPATLMIILGLGIRMFALNRLPKMTFVIIWTLVSIRLIVPFSIPLFPIPMANHFSQNNSQSMGWHIIMDNVNSQQLMIIETPAPAPTINSIPTLITAIWLAGVFVFALYFAISHYNFRRAVADSLPIKEDFVFDWQYKLSRPVQLRSSQRISSPLTYGIMWPIILMPATMDFSNKIKLQYILTHEYVHIRRFDCVLKTLFAVVLCLNWFNPFVWIMFILANRDIELSCDEAVLKELGGHSKTAYAMTLLDMMEDSVQYSACNFANLNKSAVEERITILANTKKTSVWGSVAAIALVLIPMLFIVSYVVAEQPYIRSAYVSFSVNSAELPVPPQPPLQQFRFVQPVPIEIPQIAEFRMPEIAEFRMALPHEYNIAEYWSLDLHEFNQAEFRIVPFNEYEIIDNSLHFFNQNSAIFGNYEITRNEDIVSPPFVIHRSNTVPAFDAVNGEITVTIASP